MQEKRFYVDKDSIRFLYLTDTHYNATSPASRKDDLLEASLLKTQEVLEIARKEKADVVLHGGDFFQRPDVTDLVAGRVAGIIKEFNMPFFVVPGGHDIYGNNIETIYRTKLGLLAKAGLVELLIHPQKEYVLFAGKGITVQVTGTASHFGMDVEGIEDDYVLQYKNADYAVHIVHGMLVPYPFIPHIPSVLIDSIVHTKADITLAGHYHIGFAPVEKNGRLFINCGALVRRTNDLKEINRIPQVVLIEFSAKGISYRMIPLKTALPGEEVLDRNALLQRQEREVKVQSFLGQIKTTQGMQAVNIQEIIEMLSKNKNLPSKVVQVALERISKMQSLIDKG